MAVGDKVFLDTDVALDHLADRQPFAEYAHRLFALAEKAEITLCLSALSFSNLYYILRKLVGHGEALALLGKLKQLVRVSAVGEAEIQSALAIVSRILKTRFSTSRRRRREMSAQSSPATRLITPAAKSPSCRQTNSWPCANRRLSE